MRIAQRGTSSSSSGYHTVDRMRIYASGTDELAFTQSQSTDAPDGFDYSFKVAINTAESSWTTTEWIYFRYVLEGRDNIDLAFGTSSAKKTTVSFWVKSSVIGNYAVLFFNDNGVDSSRNQTLTYTINSANTWEYKTITFDGDTAQVLHTGANAGADLYWVLSTGPDRNSSDGSTWGTYTQARGAYGQTADVGGTLNATWQIAGLQFETGDVATPFEHRSYGEELSACMRYYQKLIAMPGESSCDVCNTNQRTTTAAYGVYHLVTPMRSAPTLSIGSLSDFILYAASTSVSGLSALTFSLVSTTGSGRMAITNSSFGAAGNGGWLAISNATNYLGFDSEL